MFYQKQLSLNIGFYTLYGIHIILGNKARVAPITLC